jgi:tetratricopeptide (TPR) repeat protein
MDCNELKTHLLDYLYDELSPAQREAVEGALSRCPDCAQELKMLRQVIAQAENLPMLDLSPQGRANIIREARLELDKMGGKQSWGNMFWQLFRSPAFATLAVTALVLGVLWTLADQGRQRPPDSTVAAITDDVATELPEPISEMALSTQTEEQPEEAILDNREVEEVTHVVENEQEINTVAQLEPQGAPGTMTGDENPERNAAHRAQNRSASRQPASSRHLPEHLDEVEDDVQFQLEATGGAAAAPAGSYMEQSDNLLGRAAAGNTSADTPRPQYADEDSLHGPAKAPIAGAGEVHIFAAEEESGALAESQSTGSVNVQDQISEIEEDWGSIVAEAAIEEEAEAMEMDHPVIPEEAAPPEAASMAGSAALLPVQTGQGRGEIERSRESRTGAAEQREPTYTSLYREAVSQFNRAVFEDALSSFRAVLSAVPRNHEIYPEALFYTGSSLMSLNRYTEAISTLTQLLNLSLQSNRSDEVRYMLGQAYELTGDRERAMIFYEALRNSDGSFQERASESLDSMMPESP